MKNIDGVDLDNLVPNEDDLFGWKDSSTGKNYWLMEDDDLLQVAPMIRENIIEVRYVAVQL